MGALTGFWKKENRPREILGKADLLNDLLLFPLAALYGLASISDPMVRPVFGECELNPVAFLGA